jgi:hypothetical protein
MRTALVLFIEVTSCLFLFLLILVLLNYLNILSLSTIYPKQFGFLPTISSLENSKGATNTTLNKPVTSSSKQTTTIGEIKQATANSISIISPSNKNALIEFRVDENTIFQQVTAFDAKTTKSASFAEFKQIMITDKNHVIKIYYVNDGSINFAGKVLFLN